jgi:hypothetical protein
MGKTFLGVHYPPVGRRDGLGVFLDAGAAGVVTFQCGWSPDLGQFYATRFQADENDNPPNFYTDPLQAARDHFNGQQDKWAQNPGAMARLSNNELDIETPWHGQQQVIFDLEFMRLCETVGESAGICNYSGGNPTDNAPYTFEERWRSVLPAVKYAGENGHYVVLHIHQQDAGPMESPGGQSVSIRHRRSIAYWLNNAAHPECIITQPPQIIFNEVSNGVGGVEPNEDGYFNSVTWLDQQCRNDPYNSLYTVLCLYQAGGGEPISQSMYSRLAEYTESQSEIVINPLPVEPPPVEVRVFDYWLDVDTGENLGSDNPLTFNITSNRTIRAVTKKKPDPNVQYTCTVSTDGYGTVTGGGQYDANAVVTLEWIA